MARLSSRIRGATGRGPSSGHGAQRFPAGAERVSTAVPVCAPLSPRAPVRALREPAPRAPDFRPSPALSASFLCAPIDNGWQLPALRTKVRPALPFAPPSGPQTPPYASGASPAWLGGRQGLRLAGSAPGCARGALGMVTPVHCPTGRGAGCGLRARAAPGGGDSSGPPLGPELGSALHGGSGSRTFLDAACTGFAPCGETGSKVGMRLRGSKTRAKCPHPRPFRSERVSAVAQVASGWGGGGGDCP